MEKIAFMAAIILPLWNIPLIVRIIKRKSSKDISIYWVLGVWVCFLLMAPDAFSSTDPVWRIFNIMNLILFTAVVITVLAYRKTEKTPAPKVKGASGERNPARSAG